MTTHKSSTQGTGELDNPNRRSWNSLLFVAGRRLDPCHRLAASVADIVDADVKNEDGELILVAEGAEPLPQRLSPGTLELRWRLVADDGSTWTISAFLDDDLVGAISSSSGYDSGTIDETIPGACIWVSATSRSSSTQQGSRIFRRASSGPC